MPVFAHKDWIVRHQITAAGWRRVYPEARVERLRHFPLKGCTRVRGPVLLPSDGDVVPKPDVVVGARTADDVMAPSNSPASTGCVCRCWAPGMRTCRHWTVGC